jgi:class 3 adenylate cyclase
LLAVLISIVLGVSLGSRSLLRMRRALKAERASKALSDSVPPSDSPVLGESDLAGLVSEFPAQTLELLRRNGQLPKPQPSGDKRWWLQVVSAYVGDEVLAKLQAASSNKKDAGSIELAQAVSGTVLFFDLRGFTAATEHLGGAYVMRLLNVYLNQMAEVVAAYGGVVDKFIGDNVMATFGAVKSLDTAADNASQCAQVMIERMVQINEQLSERGLPSLRPSVGLASGEMVAGTLGGKQRRSFTVIGACVNRAARLEFSTRDLGVDLLMDRQTYELLVEAPWGMKVHHQLVLRGVVEPILAWSWTRPKVTTMPS